MDKLYRFKITLEYLGTNLVGWQVQNNGLSVQQVIETAIYNFSKERVNVIGAGRTDAGVHAIAQVAHFDLENYFEPYKITKAINHFVQPHLVTVLDCELVTNQFHARISAKTRHYLYLIVNRSEKLAIDYNRAWWVKNHVDVQSMKEATRYLIGKHDFSSFRSSKCQSLSPIKTLTSIVINKDGDKIHLLFSAKSFLHKMVRNIVGSLILVGLKKWKPYSMKYALDARNRALAGATAPAAGLYFLKVDY